MLDILLAYEKTSCVNVLSTVEQNKQTNKQKKKQQNETKKEVKKPLLKFLNKHGANL